MSKQHLLSIILVAALVVGWNEAVRAESARGLVAQGNALYAAGQFEEAKKLYEEAAGKDPNSPEVQYNLGNARYKLNDFAGAAEAYQQATAQGRDPSLISKGEFNLGNTVFRQGEAAEATDPKAAMDSFQESIGHFRSALDLDKGFKAAGRNLEVSKRRLQKAQEELKRQQEAKDEEKRQQEEMTKDLEQMAKEQQGLADQSREEAGKPQADNETKEGQAGEQQELMDRTKAMQQKMGQGSEQKDAKQSLDEAAKEQQEAVDKLRGHKPEEAAQAQDEAAKAMRQAQEKLAGKDEQPPAGNKQDKQEDGQSAPPEQAPGQEEAKPPAGAEAGKPLDQTAQDLLNEEKQNMRQRRSQGMTGVEAVDKDW